MVPEYHQPETSGPVGMWQMFPILKSLGFFEVLHIQNLQLFAFSSEI